MVELRKEIGGNENGNEWIYLLPVTVIAFRVLSASQEHQGSVVSYRLLGCEIG